jgi:hypothetical protein
LSSSDFSSSCFTELKGGSSFVTDRFFEKSGFSFEIIGANRKIKIINTRKAKEKFNLLVIKRNLFLKNSIRGIIKRKNSVDKDASIKLKLKTTNAEEVLVKNSLMKLIIKERESIIKSKRIITNNSQRKIIQ